MKSIRVQLLALLFFGLVGLPASVCAQITAEAPIDRIGYDILRVGQDYTVRAGGTVRDVTVIFGDLTVDGHVEQDVVVVFGKVQLGSAASVDRSLLVIGGSASAAPGATVGEDFVIVGGGLDAASSFSPGGHHIVIGTRFLGAHLDAVVPWLTRGLLWGRLIVPDLGWVWRVAGVFFLVSLALNAIFDRPVGTSAATLAEKPLTAFGVGLLVLLLTGPISLLLAVSVVGLAVVPFMLCAILVAAIIGRVAATRCIGMAIVPQDSRESRLQSLRSFAIGSALICVAYMVPVIGLLTWSMLWVFGLGAATLAFVAAYRRENPARPPRTPAPAPAPPAAPATYQNGDATALPNHRTAVPAASEPPPTAATMDLASFPRAPFRDRLAAFALDLVLVAVVYQLLDPSRRNDSTFPLLVLAYHIVFWTWKSTTVGGIICQLRVVRVDGTPLRFVDALVRALSGIFSLAVLGIGFLWILRDPERQAWHDKVAGTYVVRVPRNWPL